MKCPEKMKIAMLGHKRIPSREGGVEVVVGELAVRMCASGYAVTCYNRRGHHVSGTEFDEKSTKTYQGVHIKTVPTIERKGLAAMSASFFAAICAAFGPYDVVHFHAEGPCAMLWLPKLFGKRCVATIHGLDHQRAKWGRFARNYIIFGEKVAVRFADEIIVLSKGVQEYFKTTYNRGTTWIPNGVNRPELQQARLIRQVFGLGEGEYILFLGRLVPEKGIAYLIEAFRNVTTDKKLVIAGGSSDTQAYAQELREMAEGDTRILFTGFVQGQMLEELYSNAYIYVLPSDLEGMPLSLLEAMSYGNCCLVSDLPECADVVADKGVTFRKGDPADLRERLQMLCDRADIVEAYRKTAQNYICGKYNWDDVAEKTLRVYHEDFDD